VQQSFPDVISGRSGGLTRPGRKYTLWLASHSGPRDHAHVHAGTFASDDIDRREASAHARRLCRPAGAAALLRQARARTAQSIRPRRSAPSVTGGLIGATTLLIINWLVVRFLYSHPGLEKIVEGQSDCLISNGKILHDNLKRETITIAELELAARRQGFASLEGVESCRLEVGGALTFVARHPTETEERHSELLARLDALAAAQARLGERLDALPGGGRG